MSITMVYLTEVGSSRGVGNFGDGYAGVGQIATKCRHVDCGDRVIGIDLTAEIAGWTAAAHTAMHERERTSDVSIQDTTGPTPDMTGSEADMSSAHEDIEADIDPQRWFTTGQLATALAVSPRHVRRLAAQYGVRQLRRGRWATADVDAMIRQHPVAPASVKVTAPETGHRTRQLSHGGESSPKR